MKPFYKYSALKYRNLEQIFQKMNEIRSYHNRVLPVFG